ncbi:hypothetical protein M5C99_22710 [Acidovorax sp. NCPPB 2350]|nr:hypothetical protein M5C99_22710 [Acidovorax sp. NCPPB 2350]
MLKKLSISVLMLAALLCIAADYGRYLCRGCTTPMSPPDVRAFVSVHVNPNVPMWQANDTVSICNGSVCVKYLTPSSNAVMWSPVGTTPDPGHGYKGVGESVTGTYIGDYFAISLWAPMETLIAEGWDFSGLDGVVYIEPMCTGNSEHDAKIGACG